jgi:histidinol dehydrogenase
LIKSIFKEWKDTMVLLLCQRDQAFEKQFISFLSRKREISRSVNKQVSSIIRSVRKEGDKALFDYSWVLDEVDLSVSGLKISCDEISSAVKSVSSETMDALSLSCERIEVYHRKQIPEDVSFTDSLGVELGWRWTAVDSVGLYIPGGTASYPSSVLMNGVPAKVAGVERIVMVVPCKKGIINPLVLAAADLVGIHEIYRIGGAQAIAALAYGTETIKSVVKIVGPGNAYVASAKRQVFGKVGIDMIAGPSEILVIADEANDPDWIASDLLSQAEHDSSAQAILITNSRHFANEVRKEVDRQLMILPRVQTALASWHDFGAIILVDDLRDAVCLSNRIAPEHLELAVKNPEFFLPKIRNAGAIFLGSYTPEAMGDYIGGSNHVLPTSGSASFSSPLSVLDYMKRTSLLKLHAEQLKNLGPFAMRLAQEEGLEAHARSIAIRL